VKNLVEKKAVQFWDILETAGNRFHFFQNPTFHRFLKVESVGTGIPQNFPLFFPFHSTIFPHLHHGGRRFRISHFFTFSPVFVCGEKITWLRG
jgi:hypothetical protein